MRLPSWLRRRHDDYSPRHVAPVSPGADMPSTTVSERTKQAQQAARDAAIRLQESRDRRPDVDATVEEIARVNRENGFAELFRHAFGSSK